MLFCLLSSHFILCLILFQISYVHRVSAKKVCCELTGCFNDESPFNKMPLPWCTNPRANTPSYRLFTRANRDIPSFITPTYFPKNSTETKRTYFISHGWTGNWDMDWVKTMKDLLLEKENANVVLIDWKVLAGSLNYPKSASSSRTVGAYTALVMKNIREMEPSTYLWCIGHSLGAHVCAHTGAKIRLDRITGLDPAGPWFSKHPNVTVGLNNKSADFVDVIHSNYLIGTQRPLGHLDFYPNGVSIQPGCLHVLLNMCSHAKSPKYFIESIKQNCFLATKKCSHYENLPDSCEDCEGCAVMGYGAINSKVKSGIMYLTTQKDEPYCLPPSS